MTMFVNISYINHGIFNLRRGYRKSFLHCENAARARERISTAYNLVECILCVCMYVYCLHVGQHISSIS